jgi:hypothetical protein
MLMRIRADLPPHCQRGGLSPGSVRNRLASPMFALQKTESGGGPTERGGRAKPVREKGIRRSGGRLAGTWRANGVD